MSGPSFFPNASSNQFYSTVNNVAGNQTVYSASQEKRFGIPVDRITYAALFNSAASEGAAKCLPDTRVDVLGMITEWVQGTSGELIGWVYGPAGSGKTTIARTIADQFSDRAATFFFSRNSTELMTNKNFFPTICYFLATLFPSVGQEINTTLTDSPDIILQNLPTQLDKLILQPLRARPLHIKNILIIIDGLDESIERECADLLSVFSAFARDSGRPKSVRLLLFSRYEPVIHEGLQCPYSYLDLWQFSAHSSIHTFFREEFTKLYQRRYRFMGNVGWPWPDDYILGELVQKSEGLFIYASTLVKFVGSKAGLPHERLQKALKQHSGMNSLYIQVISDALSKLDGNEDFEAIFWGTFSALLVVRESLPLSILAYLLSCQPEKIQMALDDCGSILMLPDNNDPIQFYHASLPQFLMDKGHAGKYYRSPGECHILVVDGCASVMKKLWRGNGDKIDGNLYRAGKYACSMWFYHVMDAMENMDGIIEEKVLLRWVDLTKTIAEQWFPLWTKNVGARGYYVWKWGINVDDIVKLVLSVQKYENVRKELEDILVEILKKMERKELPQKELLQDVSDEIGCCSRALLWPSVPPFQQRRREVQLLYFEVKQPWQSRWDRLGYTPGSM